MDIANRERAKYQKVWTEPTYRVISPGFNVAPAAFISCRMQRGESLTDYGCGTGRAARYFVDQELQVFTVDFAPNALEQVINFYEACLWDLPAELPMTDWAFCSDVMEHIPPEMVRAALEQIASKTKKGGFFQIPHVGHDAYGESLHLTVQPSEWWHETISDYFTIIEQSSHVTNRSSYTVRAK